MGIDAIQSSNVGLYILLIMCTLTLCAVVVAVSFRWKMIKMIHTLEDMLDQAAKGSFTEETFDESRLSALESRFAHYLLASKLSVRNVAEEHNKIKELITDISHQTKTPIANMILYSELLMENCRDEEERKDIEALYQQAQKLHFLIASLVKLSRLETGIVTVHPDKNNITQLVESVCHQYQPLAAQKGLYLKLGTYDAAQNDTIAEYDEKWTAEAVGNIVDNAVKYTQKGGITISVRLFEMFCCIEIADTGDGISEEELAKVFKRFYRSQSAHQVQGIGIGLYLAREIISAENGYIKVDSKMGKGTRFCVYLPR